jgi:hypothetical protein
MEIKRLNPYLKGWLGFGRTLYFMLISFFYSYTIGFLLFFLTQMRNLVFDRHALETEFYDLKNLDILYPLSLPNESVILFLFTFFAMFIGIFLNMMIQEKRATEPL